MTDDQINESMAKDPAAYSPPQQQASQTAVPWLYTMTIEPANPVEMIDVTQCVGVTVDGNRLHIIAPEHIGPDEAETLARIILRRVAELKTRKQIEAAIAKAEGGHQ